MKIQEIYDKYNIMPNLQEHLLRVAGVASLIVDNFERDLDKNSIISACLLHDMGNIIKFHLGSLPEFIEPKGLSYWKKVQKDFINRYGSDEHIASYKICEEIGVSEKVMRHIKQYGFSQAKKTYSIKILNLKIGPYSDHRTNPFGVVSLNERFQDVKTRYAKRTQIYHNQLSFSNLCSYWVKIEKQIFAHCKIRPEDITEEIVRPLFKKLRNFDIGTR
jgi:hypothetical protein